MNRYFRTLITLLLLASVGSLPVMGQNQIPDAKLSKLEAARLATDKSRSAARKKLALRRVIREGETLIKNHPAAANRFGALHIIFRAQQSLVGVDKTSTARNALLATCEKLAAAPN